MAQTAAQRQAAARERKKAAGLKPIMLWVKPEHEAGIREFADKHTKTSK